MTTITIERALLEQALNALLLPCDRWNAAQHKIVTAAADALLTALAAPATAPTQPAWHDAPTCAGVWVNSISGRVNVVIEETQSAWQHSGARYYGPIPSDSGDRP